MTDTLTTQAFTIELGGGIALNGEIKALEDGIRKPVLVISHGFRGFKEWGFWPYVSTWFAEKGFYVVVYDFSRISVKNGDFSETVLHEAFRFSRELADLETLLKHIQRRQLPLDELADTSRIALIGHSRAGSSSIVFAAEHPEVGAVVALNASAKPQVQGDGPQERIIAADLRAGGERFDIPSRLASFKGAALIIQGTNDNERLLEGFEKLKESAPSQTFVSIAGADHTFGISHPFPGVTPYLEETLEVANAFLQKWKEQ